MFAPQVWLPPKDDVLAPGVFNQGTPGPRWFDFSSAPDVDGFESSSCSADITWAGQRAFRMHQREKRKGLIAWRLSFDHLCLCVSVTFYWCRLSLRALTIL